MIKQKCFAWIMCITAGLGMISCQEDVGFKSGSAVGKIAPRIELNTDVASSKKSAARAETSITANDLALKISASDGSYSGSWNSIADFPTENSFAIGTYVVEALYGSVETEGFDCPAYYGSQNITVSENKTTEVALTATLANTMLSVDYTDTFKNYMTSWSAEAHSTGGEYVYYTQDETRAAYLRPGTVTLSVEFTKPNGTKAKLQVAQFDVAARHHYHMTIDMNNGGAGDAVLTVIYDETLATENVDINLSDELLNAPAPTITGDGVTNGSIINYMEGDLLPTLRTNIIARGSLAGVTLTTQSTDLLASGWPKEIDLIAATASQQETLKKLGLNVKGLWQSPDKIAVVDFSEVLNHTYDAVFTLQVRDTYSKVSDAFSFSVKVTELTLELESIQKWSYAADELTMNVKYNGSNVNGLKVFTKNSSGTFEEATIKRAESTTAGSYALTIATNTTDTSIEFYVTAAGKKTSTVSVQRSNAPVTVSYNAYDVWATKATVHGTIVDASALTNPQLVYRKQGASSWTTAQTSTSGTTLTANLTGLSANTTYELMAMDGSTVASASTTFTTEAANQLPNADMESEPTVSLSGSYWQQYDFTDGWGTNNPMTTSQGSAYAYCRISGTIPTTDAHGGSQATLIRTVGWGSGNTAIGSVKGVCKYIDAGLYHIGDSRSARPDGYSSTTGTISTDDLTTGMSFTSRPTSMSLWYKYTAKNSSDNGVAEVYVYDASGNIIATGSASLTATGNYIQKTVSLTYSRTNAKAAKIYVKFLSTYSEDFLTKTSANLSAPGFGNLSTGTYMGSQLYIDDISLNY